MTAHEIHALSGAYAVDALDDDERARFEEHLAVCTECRAEVAGLQDAAAMLATTSAAAPPASLRDKVLADIKTVRPLPPTVARLDVRRRSRRWSGLVAAAAVLGVLGGGVAVWQQQDDRTSQAPPVADAKIQAVLSASDVEHATAKLPGGASATAFRSADEHAAVLVTRSMPDAPAGRIYQVWLQKGGLMIPAGEMTTGGDNTVLLKGDPGDATAVGVTVEPEGGSEEPTSAPVALMDFGQA